MYADIPLRTTAGEPIEVLDPGLWNHDAGPDFFNAKIKIGQQTWVGNVEIHQRSTDWQRHHHEADAAYENVILHVVAEADAATTTPAGRPIPQMELAVPPSLAANFHELMTLEAYPPCYAVIPTIPRIAVHAWMSALTVERLETKTQRVDRWLSHTCGDWERTFFIIIARALGFGVNSDNFELWASQIDLTQVGKHRDDLIQVEAFFLGTAGLLDRAAAAESNAPKAALWQREWRFLQSKFGLEVASHIQWKLLRMRPQNFPYVRLLQLAQLFHACSLNFSSLLSATDAEQIRGIFHEALPQAASATLDLLLINVASPMLFAYGRSRDDENKTELAFTLLESIKAERNHIMRSWQHAGLDVTTAADSQALIQLRTRYCDRKDCLRCRFGAEFLKHKSQSSLS